MNYLYVYLGVIALIVLLYARRRQRIQSEHAVALKESLEAGLGEPALPQNRRSGADRRVVAAVLRGGGRPHEAG